MNERSDYANRSQVLAEGPGLSMFFILALFLLSLLLPSVTAHAQETEWQVLGTEDFILYYRPDDLNVAEASQIGDELQSLLGEVRALLDLNPDPDERIEVYLAGRGELSGITDEGNLLLRRDQQTGEYDLLAHELTHMLMANVSAEAPVFLREGIAVYLQERLADGAGYPTYDAPADLYSAGFLQLNMLVPLTRLHGAEHLYAVTNQPTLRSLLRWQGYIEAGSFVKYLFDEYGPAGFKDLYRGAGFESVYGHSLDALEEAWIQAALKPRAGEPMNVMLPTDGTLYARREFAFTMNFPNADYIRRLDTPGGVLLHKARRAERLGRTLLETNRWAEARSSFELAAQRYDGAGARDEARDMRRQAQQIENDRTRAFRERAEQRLSRGKESYRSENYREARAALEQAKSLYAQAGDPQGVARAQGWVFLLREARERRQSLREKGRLVLVGGLILVAVVWAGTMYAMRQRGGEEMAWEEAKELEWEEREAR